MSDQSRTPTLSIRRRTLLTAGATGALTAAAGLGLSEETFRWSVETLADASKKWIIRGDIGARGMRL